MPPVAVSFITPLPPHGCRAPPQAEFTSDKFSRVEDVLRAVRHMLALEVAYEPHIRGELRKAYLSGAQLSTRPTLKGRAEIKDPMHPVYGIHYISVRRARH